MYILFIVEPPKIWTLKVKKRLNTNQNIAEVAILINVR